MSPEEDVLIISVYLSATVYLDGFLIISHFSSALYDHGLNGNNTMGKEWRGLRGCASQEVL